MTTPMKDVPLSKKLDIPPLWLLGGLLVSGLLNRLAPIMPLPGFMRLLGWAMIVAAIALVVWTFSAFKQGDTPIHPRRKPRKLLTDGPFALSRNPIYLAMAAVALGAGLAMGSLGALLAPPVLIRVLQSRFIAGEEFHIEKNFGDEWRAYAARTRRWL